MEKFQTGSQLVAAAIAREGVGHVFCVPGESYLGVMDAILDYPEIQLISNRQESGAAFMAEAYAKATRRVGVCMATRGVGAANLAIGLHTARQDSTPVVAFLGQVEQKFKEREAFQEVALDEWFRPLCKWAVEIRDVDRIPELVQRAFAVAQSGRPGPVVVALPHDIVHRRVDYPIWQPTRGTTQLPGPSPAAIEDVHNALMAAQRPVLIVGGGVLRSGATAAAIRVAERYQLPVVTAFRRFDAFPNNHPCYAGWLGFGPDSALLQAIRDADVVLTVGTRLSQVTSQDYTLISGQTVVKAVDVDVLALGSGHIQADLIQSDARLFFEALGAYQSAPIDVESSQRADKDSMATATTPEHAKRRGRVTALHQGYRAHSTPPAPVESTPASGFVNLDLLIEDFNRMVSDEAIITTDAGNFHGWLGRFRRFRVPGTYIGPTSGAMGYGLPAAIAAKFAYPDKTVVSFSGDGGFMMTLFELETANRYQLPIVSIVVNNYLYGTIRAHQEREFPGRVSGTELGNPSFAAIATAFGGYGVRITRNEEFVPALQTALAEHRFSVIEVMTDPQILSVAQRPSLSTKKEDA